MKQLIRWQKPEVALWSAFGGLFGLHAELDRLFENSFAGLSRSQGVWNPAIDLFEDKESVTVKAELAGLKKEDITVSIQEGKLTISGARKSDKNHDSAGTHRSERFVGQFQRVLKLPADVKDDQIKADYKDGILTVNLPKAEAAKPKQIQVNVNN